MVIRRVDSVAHLVKRFFVVDEVIGVGYFRRYEITSVAKNVRRGTRHRTEYQVPLRLSGVCQEEYILGCGQRVAANVVLLSCGLQRVRSYRCYPSRTSASTVFERSAAVAPPPRTNNTYEIPDTFVSVSRRVEAESYLRKVGAYDAYLSGAADIRYDVRMNRVVFLIREGKRVIDAAGRALDGRGPKWYRYGSSRSPFVSDAGTPIACVVEDCASACSVCSIVSGVALFGTNLLAEHIEVLKRYDRVFVALDKDATDKAITMVRTLHSHVPTRLMVLHTDLKNMEKDERNDFLRSHINR